MAPQPVVDEAGAAPAAPLAGLVRGYGGSRIEGARPGIHRGLPSPDLELDICLGAPIELAAMPNPSQPPGSFTALVAGLQTRPAIIAHGGSAYAVSVQLTPAGARSLLGVSAVRSPPQWLTWTRCSAGSGRSWRRGWPPRRTGRPGSRYSIRC